MSVKENLDYYAMLYGLSNKERRNKVDELMDLFDLKDFARIKFDELSTGTKQKLSLSKALLNDPDLLLLDEPSVGLDPDVAHKIREFIKNLHRQKGTTILMTTHNMKEAETLCEQVAFIKGGLIKACGTPAELKHNLRLGDTINIVFKGHLPELSLKNIKGIYGFNVNDSTCSIQVDNHHDRLPEILDFFISQKVFIHDLKIKESDLEDVFIAFTR
jgi:ABC-2 type transport system ATP-binding protein